MRGEKIEDREPRTILRKHFNKNRPLIQPKKNGKVENIDEKVMTKLVPSLLKIKLGSLLLL